MIFHGNMLVYHRVRSNPFVGRQAQGQSQPAPVSSLQGSHESNPEDRAMMQKRVDHGKTVMSHLFGVY